MKRLLSLFFAIFLCGCTTTSNVRQGNVNLPPDSKNRETMIARGNGILSAIRDGNFQQFANLCGDKGMEMTEDEFREASAGLRKQFGTLKQFSFLSDLRAPLVHNLIWKAEFVRKGENQDRIEQDLLFRLVLGEADGKTVVVGMGFL